jgi:hypothetical protein
MSSPIGVGMGRPANMFGTVGSEPARQTTQTAQAASQAPVSLTLPATPRSDVSAGQADRVRAIASEPARAGGVAPSRADVAKGKLVAAGEKLLAARQEGVDVAKTSFWKKALGVALSGVAVGVAVGLTAISFGGATPLLALACVNFAVSTGDAICAYRNMRNTEAIADHRPPPYDSKVASYAGTAVAVASTVGGMLTDDADREQLKETLDGVRQNVTSLATPAEGTLNSMRRVNWWPGAQFPDFAPRTVAAQTCTSASHRRMDKYGWAFSSRLIPPCGKCPSNGHAGQTATQRTVNRWEVRHRSQCMTANWAQFLHSTKNPLGRLFFKPPKSFSERNR